jgi:hypothetical protein
MSNDYGQRRAKLIASAAAGIEIRVLNGMNQVVGTGFDKLELDLDEGLYAVEWKSLGVRNRTLVDLALEDSPVKLEFDPAEKAPVDTRPSLGPSASLVSRVGEALRPSERRYDSSIAVIVTARAQVSAYDILNDVRLLNDNDEKLRGNQLDTPQIELTPNDVARCYRVRPGRYELQFKSVIGEKLQQSVPALAGRQTRVFLTGLATDVLVSDGQSFARRVGMGVEPSKTVIISVAGDETDKRIRERARLAGVLLQDLALGTTSLSTDFVKILDDELTDPLLKVYGAALVLSRLERGEPPLSVDEARPSTKPLTAEQWARKAAKWISNPNLRGLPPDATVANWELFSSFPALRRTLQPKRLPKQIQVAPMLICSWRWAIEQSFRDPAAVKGTPGVVAAGRAVASGAPWLCWRAAAVKAASVPSSTPNRDLNDLVREVAERTQKLLANEPASNAPATLAELLSADAAATALCIGPTAPGSELVAPLALGQVLNLPATQLARQLANTSSELEHWIEAGRGGGLTNYETLGFEDSGDVTVGDNRSQLLPDVFKLKLVSGLEEERLPPPTPPVDTPAPGLSRQIIDPDDPQRGRFGGKPTSTQGFALSARFDDLNSKSWVRIKLRVKGKAADGDLVHFHVHDSFSPSMFKCLFKEGVAKLTLEAWGGFTVGAWIPSRKVELELNLAEVPGAPKIIRTR